MQVHTIKNENSLLEKLPVELIYEIQLSALSESLPILDKRVYEIFKSTHATYRAEYVFRRYVSAPNAAAAASLSYTQGELVTYALRFPLCAESVLDVLLRLVAGDLPTLGKGPRPLLPKRLFKPLGPRPSSSSSSSFSPPYSPTSAPLPFLRYLYGHLRIHHPRPPDANAHDGYALCRAVHAGFIDLVNFLLRQGAQPGLKDSLAVRIAIKKKDLRLVRTLIERDAEDDYYEDGTAFLDPCHRNLGESDPGTVAGNDLGVGHAEAVRNVPVGLRKKRRKSAKRRRVEDRVEVTTAMLRLAVEVDARDIVQYFLDKGARPDLSTIQRMRRNGFV